MRRIRDVVQPLALDAVLADPRPGERLNVCDGVPRRWSEHVARLQATKRLAPGFVLPEAPAALDGQRVSNGRLRARLDPAHQFTLFT